MDTGGADACRRRSLVVAAMNKVRRSAQALFTSSCQRKGHETAGHEVDVGHEGVVGHED